jgi:hypothetical protein
LKMDSYLNYPDVRHNIYCGFDGANDAAGQEFVDGVTIKEFNAASWFTPIGATLKKKELISKGLPNFKNWRFVTMTLSRELFNDPKQAYEYVNERMRYFFRDLRKEYGKFRYCYKLEFHEDGWAHWHALIEIKHKVDLDLWRKLWGNGRIEVKRADKNAQEYLFKYITKSGHLPEWVLDYDRKMRIWQTSNGFYTGKKPVSQKAKIPCKVKRVAKFRTIRQKLNNWQRTALIYSWTSSGKIIRKMSMTTSFQELWNCLVGQRLSDFTLDVSFLSPSALSVSRQSIGLLAPFVALPSLELRD